MVITIRVLQKAQAAPYEPLARKLIDLNGDEQELWCDQGITAEVAVMERTNAVTSRQGRESLISGSVTVL